MIKLKSLPWVLLLSVFTFADFTVVVIPDIQNMTWSGPDQNLYNEMQYIIDTKDELNTQFVVSLGDYTAGGYNHNTSSTSQWDVARNSVNMLLNADLPYAVCMGNHDMYYVPDYGIPQNMSTFEDYFPVSDFENYPYFGGNFYNMSNSYYLFTVEGMDFIILSLQNYQESSFDPAVADWANGVLEEYSDRRAIITTHMLNDPNSNANGIEYTTNIITKHDNVFMTVYGHDCDASGEKYWNSQTPSGNTIHNIMSDYQCRGNEGGGAVVRYYTFKPEENTVDAFTYSTFRNQFETDGNSQFSFEYEMQISPIPSIGTVTQSPDIPEEYDPVIISAKIQDDVGVNSAVLKWGESSGNLDNSIDMIGDDGIYSGEIPGHALGTKIYYMIEAEDADGNSVTSNEHTYKIETLVYSWNSWELTMNTDFPQAIVGEGEYKSNIELYESTDDNGVGQSALFSNYSGSNHSEGFNALEKFWYGSEGYPYIGISNSPRTGDEPSPEGGNDLQMHPPENKHLAVCAFTVPVDGTYKVSGLGIKRVGSESGNVALVVKGNDLETVVEVTANSQSWALDSKMYDLGALLSGDKIYFAVDHVENFNYDAAEVSWTVNLFGAVSDIVIGESSEDTMNSSSGGSIDTESSEGTSESSSTVDIPESSNSEVPDASSNENTSDINDQRAAADLFQYAPVEKKLYFYDKDIIRTVHITGLDGSTKRVFHSLHRNVLNISTVRGGVLLLRIETHDRKWVTHTLVNY
ncbi:MAG: metallophosphoesterase [Reichenbachiella sp.]